MEPQLTDLQKQLAAVTDQFQKLFAANSEEQLLRRPKNGGWSAAECVEHLTKTTMNYQDIFKGVLSDPPKGSGPFKMDFKGRMLSWMMDPPFWIKIKTRPMVEPHGISSATKVLADFEASQKMLTETIARTDGLALEKIIIASPFEAKMKYNLFSCFNILASHQRRHYVQAEEALK